VYLFPFSQRVLFTLFWTFVAAFAESWLFVKYGRL